MGKLIDFYRNNERYRDSVNFTVLRFIEDVHDFPDREGVISENIDHLFCARYCYYFANMLKMAFGGKVCWAQDRGHIVWVDCDENCTFEELQLQIAYDVTGIFDDYERLWPIEYLGDAIAGYMYNGKELHVSGEFKDWCDFLNVTEEFAIGVIWGIMPESEILEMYAEGLDYVQTAYQYWMRWTNELQQVIRDLKTRKFITPRHNGIADIMAECCATESSVFE